MINIRLVDRCPISANAQYVSSAHFPRSTQQSVLQRTVRLVVSVPDGTSFGSGVVVGTDPDGFFVATAPHVIDSAFAITVETFTDDYPQPTRRYTQVHPLVADTASEFALLHVAGRFPLRPVALCPPGQEPLAGSAVLSIGCGGGTAPTCEVNQLLGHDREHWHVHQHGTQGRSGGALVSESGYVIGCCCCGTGDRTLYSYLGRMHRALDHVGLSHLYEPRGVAVAARGNEDSRPARDAVDCPDCPPRRDTRKPDVAGGRVGSGVVAGRFPSSPPFPQFPPFPAGWPFSPGDDWNSPASPVRGIRRRASGSGSASGAWSVSVTIINGRLFVNGERER